MKELHQAIAEVLDAYFNPDSPEALACAIYQLRRVYKKDLNGTPAKARSE